MALRVLVKRSEHDWQDDLNIVADEVAKVFIVPEVQGTFCDLEVRTCYRFCELVEERLLDFGELCRIHHFEDILDFIKKHDFFGAIDLGPVSKEAKDDLEMLVKFSYLRKKYQPLL